MTLPPSIPTAALLDRLRSDTFNDSQRSVEEIDPTFRKAWNAAMHHVEHVILPEVCAAEAAGRALHELAAMPPMEETP